MATIEIKKRNFKKQIRNFTAATIAALLLSGFYGYSQYLKLAAAQTALAQEQQNVSSLQSDVTKMSKGYADLKESNDEKFSTITASLQKVYPLEESYTDAARLFDKFFSDSNTNSNPVVISDLKFGLPRIEAAKEYAILPVTMTISGTKDNFMKFLKFVQDSGVLEDETRLMDINSISINFNSSSSSQSLDGMSSEPLLNVSVSLNAYFQKPFKSATPTAK